MQTQKLENPDFFAKFGSNTTSSLFLLDGWTLGSSVETYWNEGLASILTNNDIPRYSRIEGGFLSNSLFLQIGIPILRILKSIEWYGTCWRGGSCHRNAKDIMLWASNNNYYNNWIKIRNEAKLIGEFRIDYNSGTTNPTKINLINNETPFLYYYFNILNNWGDSSVKINRIKLTFT